MEIKPESLTVTTPLPPTPMRRRQSMPTRPPAPPPSGRAILYASCLSAEGDCAVLCKWHAMELFLPNGTVRSFYSEVDFATEIIAQINAHKKSVQLVSYNGRVTLLPRLNLICALNGIAQGFFCDTGDRYASFSTRFNQTYHLDLADWLTNYAASEVPPLSMLSSKDTLSALRTLHGMYLKAHTSQN